MLRCDLPGHEGWWLVASGVQGSCSLPTFLWILTATPYSLLLTPYCLFPIHHFLNHLCQACGNSFDLL
jgi:hypothetical protein